MRTKNRFPRNVDGLMIVAVLAVQTLAACVLASCAGDAREPADRVDPPVSSTDAATVSTGGAVTVSTGDLSAATNRAADLSAVATGSATAWEPAGDYWKAYRAVLVIASCDSAGVVESTDLLYSYASPAETDSALRLAEGLRFDPESWAGRIRFGGAGPKRPGGPRFIVPVPTRGGAIPPPGIPSRVELEQAGLGSWLAICDELLPGWPFETWVVTGSVEHRPCHPDRVVEDAKLRAAGLVSLSPNGRWAIHPFNSIDFMEDGRFGTDVDGGFVLYESAPPHAARDHMTGPGTWFLSAEWLDSTRFVLPVISEAGVSIGGMWMGFRTPELWVGCADSSTVAVLRGPPISPPETAAALKRFQAFQIERYPELERNY